LATLELGSTGEEFAVEPEDVEHDEADLAAARERWSDPVEVGHGAGVGDELPV
jgi:hypothetical protein